MLVHDAHATACDCPERVLLVARNAELSDEEDVERRMQRAGDLECDGDSPAGEPKDDHIVAAGELAEPSRELAAGFGAVAKTLVERRALLIHPATIAEIRSRRVRAAP